MMELNSDNPPRDGGHIRPYSRVTFAPNPKGVTFAPIQQYFKYVTQPFRV